MTETDVSQAPAGATFYRVSEDGHRLRRLRVVVPATPDGAIRVAEVFPDGRVDAPQRCGVSYLVRQYHPTFEAARQARVAELEGYLAHARALQPPEDET